VEAVVEALLEFVFELVIELLVEIGWTALTSPASRPASPLPALVGYPLVGTVLGGLSLLLLPHHLVDDPALRLTTLVVSPIFAGLAMAGVGALRRKRGQDTIRLDSFLYGALFALALAGVRYAFAT
jgi:hypothetical protein